MIRFDVEGRPAPKGSRIHGRAKSGKAYTYPASKYEKPWTDAVREATRKAMRHARDHEPPYAIELEFLIEKPQKTRYDWPTATDLDKLERCVLDGLVQGKAIIDDRHVTALTSSKRFAQPDERQGVKVTITERSHTQGISLAA